MVGQQDALLHNGTHNSKMEMWNSKCFARRWEVHYIKNAVSFPQKLSEYILREDHEETDKNSYTKGRP